MGILNFISATILPSRLLRGRQSPGTDQSLPRIAFESDQVKVFVEPGSSGPHSARGVRDDAAEGRRKPGNRVAAGHGLDHGVEASREGAPGELIAANGDRGDIAGTVEQLAAGAGGDVPDA